MEFLPVSYQEFRSFFLIIIRVSIIVFMFPFFNSRVIPVLTKAGLALIITIVLFPVIDVNKLEFPATVWGLAQLIVAHGGFDTRGAP